MKKKIQIEYPLNPVSGVLLWGAISTPSGLERWFADSVSKNNKTFTFRWGKQEVRNADVVSLRSDSFIRFHWEDEDPATFFELKIHYSELTKDHILEITDFTDPEEEEDTRILWNSQIETLKRVCGV